MENVLSFVNSQIPTRFSKPQLYLPQSNFTTTRHFHYSKQSFNRRRFVMMSEATSMSQSPASQTRAGKQATLICTSLTGSTIDEQIQQVCFPTGSYCQLILREEQYKCTYTN